MRYLTIYLAGLAALSQPSAALGPASVSFRDLLAYPKYEVLFLNDLPLAESDAQTLKKAIGSEKASRGLETEEQWLSLRIRQSGSMKRLEDGQTAPTGQHETLEIMPMNLRHPSAPKDSPPEDYLCLLPSKNRTSSQTAEASQHEEETVLDPAESWQALSHLKGKCLYSRQGWFTYSYCHDSHIRQFREARHTHPHPPGGYVPEEDRSFDAYTLGQAHGPNSARKSKAALPPGHTSSTRPATHAADGQGQTSDTSVDRAQSQSVNRGGETFDAATYGTGVGSGGPGTSSRYLLQKWSDGTRCDKTGRPREIEVQIHCSMTTTDMIYLVRELAICSYVMIIHSPHLCGLPGFKAENPVEIASAPIMCRHVLPDAEWNEWVNQSKESPPTQQTLAAGSAAGHDTVSGWSGKHGKTALERALEGAEEVRASGDLVPNKHKVVHKLDLEELKRLADGGSVADMLNQALEAMAKSIGAPPHHDHDEPRGREEGVGGPADYMDDIVIVSLDESMDDLSGETDVKEGQGESDADQADRGGLQADRDRKMIMDAVKDFLQQKEQKAGKDKKNEGGRRAKPVDRDEL